MSVIDTTSEARIDTMYAMPSGANNRPSTPERANSGRKTMTTTAVPKTIALRISRLASKTTSNAGRGCVARAFCRSLRKIFSTSTIASSTSSPIATAMPPSVMTLIDRLCPDTTPNSRNTRAVIASESGIASSVMNVVRRLRRKRKSTITTNAAPIASDSLTLWMPRSIKFRS